MGGYSYSRRNRKSNQRVVQEVNTWVHHIHQNQFYPGGRHDWQEWTLGRLYIRERPYWNSVSWTWDTSGYSLYDPDRPAGYQGTYSVAELVGCFHTLDAAQEAGIAYGVVDYSD